MGTPTAQLARLRRRASRETGAVRLIGVTFFVQAAYLVVESSHDLASQGRPQQSVPGLAVISAALLFMPGLAIAKRRAGRGLAWTFLSLEFPASALESQDADVPDQGGCEPSRGQH